MTISIPLSKTGKHAGKYVAIVDDIDADLAEFNWSVTASSRIQYAMYNRRFPEKRITYLLHRVILERILGRPLVKGELVDHIDCNGLNCLRSNLRRAVDGQNNYNARKHIDNKSGHKCISWDSSRQKWVVQVRYNGRRVYIKRFSVLEDAIVARDNTIKLYHGDFARSE